VHLVGDREGLLLECAGYLQLRRLKLKHTWQLTACLLATNHQRQLAHRQYKFRSGDDGG